MCTLPPCASSLSVCISDVGYHIWDCVANKCKDGGSTGAMERVAPLKCSGGAPPNMPIEQYISTSQDLPVAAVCVHVILTICSDGSWAEMLREGFVMRESRHETSSTARAMRLGLQRHTLCFIHPKLYCLPPSLIY